MLNDIIKKIDPIAEDHQSGAAILTGQACKILELFAKKYRDAELKILIEDLMVVGRALRASQPAMAPLIRLSYEVLKITESLNEQQNNVIGACQALLNLAQDFQKRMEKSKSRICAKLINLINDGDVLITHSHSSTVRDALICAHEMGRALNVIVTESRPGFEGRTLAKELGKAGIHCELIIDSAALRLMEHTSFAIVGADCVTEKYFVNKVGSLSLALGAKELYKKFYVVSDTTKFIPSSLMKLADKQHPENEVLDEKYPNVTILNPYFEKIPLSHVTGVITEKGLLTPEQISQHLS